MPTAPEPPSSASYTASIHIGGIDRLIVVKSGSDCASLTFVDAPLSPTSRFRIETTARWSANLGTFGACVDGGARQTASGGVGSFAWRPSGTGCVADLHATMFAFTATGEMRTARLDVDGLAVPEMSATWCP